MRKGQITQRKQVRGAKAPPPRPTDPPEQPKVEAPVKTEPRYMVRITPGHPAALAGAYPVADPPMRITKEWKRVSSLTSELRALAKTNGTYKPLAEIKLDESGE